MKPNQHLSILGLLFWILGSQLAARPLVFACVLVGLGCLVIAALTEDVTEIGD